MNFCTGIVPKGHLSLSCLSSKCYKKVDETIVFHMKPGNTNYIFMIYPDVTKLIQGAIQFNKKLL